ncbi:MAG: molecular chaperone TorD family protein [Bdellovibrio sp.]|nr:molecular chaperone TorD family protein [Bdellovibrio sp.]
MTLASFKESARSRCDIYAFLATIFSQEINAEQIKTLMDSGVLEMLVGLDAKIDHKFFNRPLKEVEEDLAVEYTALFIGPGKHISLHESIYVPDSTGKMGYYWGECTADMKKWVDHYGLKISEKFESIPDHISIELEFMQRIVEQEYLSWGRNDQETAKRCIEVARTFFNKHIIKWVPLFFDKIIETAKLDFYREIATVGKAFISAEVELLNEKTDLAVEGC